MSDEPYDSGNKTQVRDAQKRDKLVRDQALEDIKRLGAMPEGRRLFARLLDRSAIFASSFTGNSTTFYNEGRRDIGLELLNDIMDADPAIYVQMISERTNKK